MIVTLSTTPALQRTMTFGGLTLDSVNRAIDVREHASGKGINVARVIHAMGGKCLATGFLGGDRGPICRRDLAQAGIAHDFVSAGVTRMCITLIDRDAHTATELIEEAGLIPSEDAQSLLQKLAQLLIGAKALVLSGTLAPGCGDDFYARCLKLANTAHVPAILDAKGAPLAMALQEKPMLVKPNRSELAQTLDRTIESAADLRDAIRAIVERGARWVAVTNGVEETVVSNGSDFWQIATPKVQAVSPIGSGDSFAAGVAIGIERGMGIPDACALGVACGAANAMTDLAGYVRREDVERLRTQIRAIPMLSSL